MKRFTGEDKRARARAGVFGKSVKPTARGYSKSHQLFPRYSKARQSCAGDYPSWCKNIDSVVKRSVRPARRPRPCVRAYTRATHIPREDVCICMRCVAVEIRPCSRTASSTARAGPAIQRAVTALTVRTVRNPIKS